MDEISLCFRKRSNSVVAVDSTNLRFRPGDDKPVLNYKIVHSTNPGQIDNRNYAVTGRDELFDLMKEVHSRIRNEWLSLIINPSHQNGLSDVLSRHSKGINVFDRLDPKQFSASWSKTVFDDCLASFNEISANGNFFALLLGLATVNKKKDLQLGEILYRQASTAANPWLNQDPYSMVSDYFVRVLNAMENSEVNFIHEKLHEIESERFEYLRSMIELDGNELEASAAMMLFFSGLQETMRS